MSVRHVVHVAIEDWALERARERHEYMGTMAHRPYLVPLQRLVNSRPSADWTPKHQGMLKAIVANGLWPQQRLWEAGLVSRPECNVCSCAGTLKHRNWHCLCTEPLRAGYGLPAAVLRLGRAHDGPECQQQALWDHALVPDPTVWLPPPRLDHQVVWAGRPAQAASRALRTEMARANRLLSREGCAVAGLSSSSWRGRASSSSQRSSTATFPACTRTCPLRRPTAS